MITENDFTELAKINLLFKLYNVKAEACVRPSIGDAPPRPFQIVHKPYEKLPTTWVSRFYISTKSLSIAAHRLIGKHCALCNRELIEGPSIDEHHLIPKIKGGRKGPKIIIHKVCHNKIHSIFTESELARVYNTPEKLLEHEEMQKFVTWVAKKHPEFCEPSKESNVKKRGRR